MPALTPPHVSAELLTALPPVLKAIVQALGIIRAREWLMEYGGVNVSIPKRYSNALKLTEGEIAQLRATLAPHMDALDRVWLPKADKLLQRARNEEMRRERGRSSLAALAHHYGLSSRQVMNICREEDNPNLPLF